MAENARARVLDRIQQRYGWQDHYVINDPFDRTRQPFLRYSRFREVVDVLGEARREEQLARDQAVVTAGYFHYLFAPKAEDHIMPTLGDWLHQWGVGGDVPESDPYEGLKNFERVYGPLNNFNIEFGRMGG